MSKTVKSQPILCPKSIHVKDWHPIYFEMTGKLRVIMNLCRLWHVSRTKRALVVKNIRIIRMFKKTRILTSDLNSSN